jgi:site-specific DNA-methyltransferase (adenine-specific)
MIQITCGDCMNLMAQYPDKYFDLAIVDPPYGLGEDGGDKRRRRKGENAVITFAKKHWDRSIPPKAYFDELNRVSKHRIIFGANYMTPYLSPSMGWIVWDKGIGGDFSDCELAYTSFRRALRKIYVHCRDDYNGRWHLKIHPCQKPVKLYRRILAEYAEPGWKILDTHLGSGSIAIACISLGFDLAGCEIDKDYYNAAVKRIKEYRAQPELFSLGAPSSEAPRVKDAGPGLFSGLETEEYLE